MPKKPKKLKYPKKPKANASLATLERYKDRVKEIDKENAARLKDYDKAVKLRREISKIRQK
jgi:hypothetical protein